MTQMITVVRDVYQRRGNKPLDLSECLNMINKRDFSKTTKDELQQTLQYYQKLNVLYVNPDEQLIFL